MLPGRPRKVLEGCQDKTRGLQDDPRGPAREAPRETARTIGLPSCSRAGSAEGVPGSFECETRDAILAAKQTSGKCNINGMCECMRGHMCKLNAAYISIDDYMALPANNKGVSGCAISLRNHL
ncbi:unnamed protein product [Prorocentrum cordatum]|uniref:Uncharacterized protein n=1 Tax=Prorocentrum cordatum TaxID=2364126 RepID=A0ABN9U2K9_9DINO|nr:unnamed protein product [Polarella glacialis]